jgi:hypothetical protein
MRITPANLLVVCVLMAIWGNSYAIAIGSAGYVASYPSSAELSWDTDPVTYAPVYQTVYLGVHFPTNYLLFNLAAIKYHVWSQGWPDATYQGFGVACWKMLDDIPGSIVWPTSGVPLYNPNTGGNWILQEVIPYVHLDVTCPQGFMVGINTTYAYPNSDVVSIDNQGSCEYNWRSSGSLWIHPTYGHLCIRAFVNDESDFWLVEPGTLGKIKAFYQ